MPVPGIGYVQELVSRLTKTRITKFDTSVNRTLVESNVTFPFDQPIYVDATHDVIISASKYYDIGHIPPLNFYQLSPQ